MDYNISYREKQGSLQVIVSYKEGKLWKKRAKQGFTNDRAGKKKAKVAADIIVNELKEMQKLNLSSDINNITIGQLKKEYIEHIRLHREYNTFMNYKQSLANFEIDDIEVIKLKVNDVQKCINDKLINKSRNTIERRIVIFKAMLNYANNQFELPIPNLTKLVLPASKDKKEKKALTFKEQEQLIKYYLENKTMDYYIAVLIAIKCGLRAGEIVGLTWNDVNFAESTITVNKQWKINKDSLQWGFGSLKSKNSFRSVPMPLSLSTELHKIKQTLTSNKVTIFDLNNKRLISATTTSSLTINLSKHLNRNFRISIHVLRHTYATTLISNGIDFKTAAMILGDDIEQVMKTYSHVNSDMVKKATKVINNIL